MGFSESARIVPYIFKNICFSENFTSTAFNAPRFMADNTCRENDNWKVKHNTSFLTSCRNKIIPASHKCKNKSSVVTFIWDSFGTRINEALAFAEKYHHLKSVVTMYYRNKTFPSQWMRKYYEDIDTLSYKLSLHKNLCVIFKT